MKGIYYFRIRRCVPFGCFLLAAVPSFSSKKKEGKKEKKKEGKKEKKVVDQAAITLKYSLHMMVHSCQCHLFSCVKIFLVVLIARACSHFLQVYRLLIVPCHLILERRERV